MHQSSVCVEVAAAHQLFQNRETSEEAPFNPRGLVLMPTLALVKGKATQCMESIGIQGRSVGFPHRNRQWEKKKVKLRLLSWGALDICIARFIIRLSTALIVQWERHYLNNLFQTSTCTSPWIFSQLFHFKWEWEFWWYVLKYWGLGIFGMLFFSGVFLITCTCYE